MRTACLLLALVPALALAADDGLPKRALADAQALRDHAVAGSDAYAIVESLTTEVGPRMAGSPGDAAAVAWAKAKFKALGYDRVTVEPVTFPAWHRGHERAEVLAPFPQKLAITALGGSVGTGAQPLEAELVEFANLDALKAAPDGSLAGKIAYISNRMARARDGSGYGPAVQARSEGAIEAAKKGAVAIVIRSIGTDHDRLPHTGRMHYADGVAQIPAAAVSNPDADLLTAMGKRGQPVRLRLDIDAATLGTATSYNVIGEILGRVKPQEVVVIGGHLDSWDLGTGAIDDGAGVAITMAAGALIGRMEHAPRRTIRVVAFANEENGLYGGKAYAEAHAAQLDAHQLGAESDFGAGRVYALRAGADPAAWPVLERIAAVLAPLGVALEKGEGDAGPDMGPFVGKGMPWAQLAQDGTTYFDIHHTANDTLDKIEPAALDQQVAAYAVLAYLAAETTVDFGHSPKEEAKP
jgi:Zn-dependent M28 family amino/carboxypeptidase